MYPLHATSIQSFISRPTTTHSLNHKCGLQIDMNVVQYSQQVMNMSIISYH